MDMPEECRRLRDTLDLNGAVSPHSICAMMDAALARSDSNGLYILPSTASTLDAIPSWLETAGAIVVGVAVPHVVAPTELLARLKAGGSQLPRIAIVFSDQLVASENAPLLVEHAGMLQYVSALEVVAHMNYQFNVSAWTGNSFEFPAPLCDPPDVLRLLLRYYSACDKLGSQWLMRESQVKRSIAYRINQTSRRLQLMHSVVLHAFQDLPLPASYRAVLKRIQEMRRETISCLRT